MIDVEVSGVRPGAVLRFGSTTIGTFQNGMRFVVPPHAAGPVDVVVDNLNGELARWPGGFTYVASASFDFNGTWAGSGYDFPSDTSVVIRFSIQNNRLTSFTCNDIDLPLPEGWLSIVDGAFSQPGPNRGVSGQIVATSQALGSIDTPECRGFGWGATKR